MLCERVLRPQMARAVLDQKIAGLRAATPLPDLVVTGNPGCLMQIGAGLIRAEISARAIHPVDLLDASYAAFGQ